MVLLVFKMNLQPLAVSPSTWTVAVLPSWCREPQQLVTCSSTSKIILATRQILLLHVFPLLCGLLSAQFCFPPFHHP